MNEHGTQRPLDEHVEAAVHRLLTEHAAVAEQGITLTRREHTLVLCGDVESPHRREQIMAVMTEHFPDVAVRCDIGVVRAQPPTEPETLDLT